MTAPTTRREFLTGGAVLIAGLGSLACAPRKTVTAIRAGLVLDGKGGRFPEHTILVEDERVVGLTPWAQTPADTDVDWQDWNQATVMPGLLEAHAHITLDSAGSFAGYFSGKSRSDYLGIAQKNAASLLQSGVTTARDLGEIDGVALATKRKIDAGTAPGPRLLCAGAPLTRPDGSAWQLGGGVESLEAALRLADAQFEAGAEILKIMGTGGVTTGKRSPFDLQFSEQELHAMIEHAHQAGRKVAVHAHAPKGIRAAAIHGADSIEHASFYTPEGFRIEAETLSVLQDSGVAVTPTMNGLYRRARAASDPRLTAMAAARAKVVAGMRAAGIPFIAGTDAGAPGVPFDGTALEVALLAGDSPDGSAAIRWATSDAARVFGLSGKVGEVSPGAYADLLVIDGDPETDLALLQQPQAVYKSGVRVV